MRAPETTKGATAETVNAPRIVDGFVGPIEDRNSLFAIRTQRLAERCGLRIERAAVVASHAFGGARQ